MCVWCELTGGLGQRHWPITEKTKPAPLKATRDAAPESSLAVSWVGHPPVPVKSFDSGDSNRDLHMLQVTPGGEFPMVIVRTSLPEDASATAMIHADLDVQFAGQTAKYKQIPFEQAKQGNETKISGTIPATLSDFKIDPPSLLTVAVKNEIPIRVEMTWRRE